MIGVRLTAVNGLDTGLDALAAAGAEAPAVSSPATVTAAVPTAAADLMRAWPVRTERLQC
jgi:hypothetical protein